VDQLNRTVADYPTCSSLTHIVGSVGTFAAAFGVYFYLIELDLPSLAVGGVVGRLVKRPRLPLDAAMAASLAHAAPGLNRLRLGPLLTPFLQQSQAQQPPPGGRGVSDRLVALVRSAEGPIDAYGGPFMFCTWLNGLATVGAATLAAHQGVDVVSAIGGALSWLPFTEGSDSISSAQALISVSASSAAAAKCTNSLTMPLRLVLLAKYGRPVFMAAERARSESASRERRMLKEMLRATPDHPGRLKRRDH
jgi:hypothetical protein